MPLLDSENLFIDTSIFVKENFLDGRRINSILDLSKQGYFKLLFSPIIINEIKIRYRKFVRVAYTLHNELVNDKKGDLKVLRNHSLGKQILARFPSEKDICKEFNDKFDQALVDCNAVILDYPTLSIEAVFSDYFSGKSPFDKADKKHEFPDAFAIAHMEQWCQQKKKKQLFLPTIRDLRERKYHPLG